MAVDYSAREAIFHAACRFYKVTKLSPNRSATSVGSSARGSTDVDLLIRTAESNVSLFSAWECAFASLFSRQALARFYARGFGSGLREFDHRERTRGALPDAIAG